MTYDPVDSDTDGTVEADVNNASVNTQEQNNTRIAEPGNIQSKLNEVGNLSNVGYGAGKTRGLVKVKPNTIYDPGSTLTVPVGVTLDASHALFSPSSNYDGVFLDNSARAYIYAINDYTYQGKICYVDTSQSTQGRYTPGQQGGVADGGTYASIQHWGNPNNTSIDPNDRTKGGVTASMRDPDGEGIYMPKWDIRSSQAGTALELHASAAGYVNTPVALFASSPRSHTTIHQDGDGVIGADIHGHIQTGGRYGIHNAGTNDVGPTYHGSLYDPSNSADYAIAGKGIKVYNYAGGPDPREYKTNNYADASEGQVVWRVTGRGIEAYYGRRDEWHLMEMQYGGFRFKASGTEVCRVEANRLWLNQDIDANSNGLIGVKEGTSNAPGIKYEGGAGIYVDSNGDPTAVDENGNTTNLM
jgi:hypothetical protein